MIGRRHCADGARRTGAASDRDGAVATSDAAARVWRRRLTAVANDASAKVLQRSTKREHRWCFERENGPDEAIADGVTIGRTREVASSTDLRRVELPMIHDGKERRRRRAVVRAGKRRVVVDAQVVGFDHAGKRSKVTLGDLNLWFGNGKVHKR